jgi:Abnormal spindle-like microcephaly-assoc'd, ASPM-SPD-2-Hydin
MKKYTRCELKIVVVLVVLSLLSAGCSGVPSSSSSTKGTSGKLAANPASIAFGSVTLNTTTTQTVQLSNPSASSIAISSASTSGPGFRLTGLAVPVTLAPGQNVTFSVMFDPSSSGAASGSVQVMPADATPPLVIALSGTGVNAVPSSHTVALSWIPSPSTIVGYNVYRGTQSGGPYAQTNSSLVAGTTYSDSSLAAGQIYWYVVTSVASSGIESAHSNEAMVTVPTH